MVVLVSFFACVDKMKLPDSINNDTEFSAGDTTYLLIQPIWDGTMGLQSPVEISIALDGHVFVADTGAKSIFVFSQNGELLSGFDDLQNLNISPIDVDVDQKMKYFVHRWQSDNIYMESIFKSGRN